MEHTSQRGCDDVMTKKHRGNSVSLNVGRHLVAAALDVVKDDRVKAGILELGLDVSSCMLLQ